jgi:hypothetical protein
LVSVSHFLLFYIRGQFATSIEQSFDLAMADYLVNLAGPNRTLEGLVATAATFAIVWGVVSTLVGRIVVPWLLNQPFFRDRALEPQKQALRNYGFTVVTDSIAAEAYALGFLLGAHHTACGCCMLPVVALGWEAASPEYRGLFILGMLNDVAWDLYDQVRMTARTFFHRPLKLDPMPLAGWVVACCLHHPLSLSMAIPLLLWYPELPAFHAVACSLLLTAGICCFFCNYKFSLDLTHPRDFMLFKGVALAHMAVGASTRLLLFPPLAWSAIQHFRADPTVSLGFFVGACACAILIGVFNVIIVFDASQTAIKWLFRPIPTRLYRQMKYRNEF